MSFSVCLNFTNKIFNLLCKVRTELQKKTMLASDLLTYHLGYKSESATCLKYAGTSPSFLKVI